MPNTYEDRILRVLAYMHDHPAEDLSLDTLADVAAMSRYHWHRVFSAMTGETCHQAVRRIRLHRAACWLVQTDRSIERIAADAGYANVRSFTRIFRDGYGLTPGAFRARGALPLLKPDRKEHPMFPVDIENHPARRLAAVPHKGEYTKIGKSFEELNARIGARNLWPHVRGVIGVYYDDPTVVPVEDLRSYAGVVLEGDHDLGGGLEPIDLPAARYAVMHHKGPYSGLKAAYDYMYGVWIPEANVELGDAPPIEVYLNSPMDTAPDELLTDVCVALKA
ncbi:MAG: AraC family transcriptional regulator [Pseudomonadota bacterium]